MKFFVISTLVTMLTVFAVMPSTLLNYNFINSNLITEHIKITKFTKKSFIISTIFIHE